MGRGTQPRPMPDQCEFYIIVAVRTDIVLTALPCPAL